MRVAEIVAGLLAGKSADGGDHAAVELQVVIAIEYVVFAVVLIVNRDLDTCQPLSENVASVDAVFVASVGVPPPVNIRLG